MEMSSFARTVLEHKYAHTKPNGKKETWEEITTRVIGSVYNCEVTVVANFADEFAKLKQYMLDRKFIPGGRYLYACGLPFHQTQNCLLLRVEDSRQGWGDLLNRVCCGLMTGAGIGVDYSFIRERGTTIKGMGGTSTGPIALMQMINECGRHIMQGGSRRSAIWAGLNWAHDDVDEFIGLKDWSEVVRKEKQKDFNFPATMDGTNISVLLDDHFFQAYDDPNYELHTVAKKVYAAVVRHMLETGEPGFSIDCGDNHGETLRNACTEVTSRDDNDICNLGSINLARVESVEEMAEITRLGVLFLLCGTMYSKVPYYEVEVTRAKNRRLGLGLMGIHEFLLKNGEPYGPSEKLAEYLEQYAKSTEYSSNYAADLGLSEPVKTRAIAPTGTISIVAETTSGIEPVFCPAFKRRYLKGHRWHAQYVIDATAKRLIEHYGLNPSNIEDALDLAARPEDRLKFQAWVQQYVDHGISSTINLPAWGTELNNEDKVDGFGKMLMKYLPQIRGITCYPDGSRGGQPLTRVPYEEAVGKEGIEFEEFGNEHSCLSGSCGV